MMIHVERVISLLKAKYTILNGVIPISLLKNNSNDICTIDCMLTVCSALSRVSNSHIGFDPDYEVIKKKRDPLLTRLLTSGWLTLLSSSYKKATTSSFVFV